MGRNRGLPPEGLWGSPDGEWISVAEHILAIGECPERFRVRPAEVAGADGARLRLVGLLLIREGWTRYRCLDGEHLFDVDFLQLRATLIGRVLRRVGSLPHEEARVSRAEPGARPDGGAARSLADGPSGLAEVEAGSCAWGSPSGPPPVGRGGGRVR